MHGGPVRFAKPPGQYGMAWTKWVLRIRVEAVPSDNHFMVKGYRYVAPGADPVAAAPVEAMRVKSVITSPRPGQQVASGGTIVKGYAWTGGGKGTIRSVEVSGDRGDTWQPALLEGPEIPVA
jgi:sulfite oxidase